jgi:hypothetical protein
MITNAQFFLELFYEPIHLLEYSGEFDLGNRRVFAHISAKILRAAHAHAR